MIDDRLKGAHWKVLPDASGQYSVMTAQIGVLMDIRDQLEGVFNLLQERAKDRPEPSESAPPLPVWGSITDGKPCRRTENATPLVDLKPKKPRKRRA